MQTYGGNVLGRDMNKELVKIEWVDPIYDWNWFYLIELRDEWLKLEGARDPEFDAPHRGDVFWVHKDEISHMEVCD